MNFFKTIFNFCLVFLLCCFQSFAQETEDRVSICSSLGITSMLIEASGPDSRVIRLKADRIAVNGQILDLNGATYGFSKKEQTIELTQKSDEGQLQSLAFDGERFVYTNNEGSILINEENIESLVPKDLNTLIVFANVLKEGDVHFDDTEVNFESPLKASIKFRQCDHVEIYVGASRSVAEKKCIDNTIKFLKTHTDCVKYGSCDISCVWGDHFCFATVFFLCNGGTCFFN